jgi:hypothetical protein
MKNPDISESSQDAAGAPLAKASHQARKSLSACKSYVRENPWVGLAGAAVLGALIVSLVRPPKHQPTAMESLRHWMENALDKIPNHKESGAALSKVLRKLHVPV